MSQSSTDPSIIIPYGHCHCGCGNLAPLVKENHPSRGEIKGQPRKYIPHHFKGGHPLRGLPSPQRLPDFDARPHQNMRPCACGGWKTRGMPQCRKCWEQDGKPPADPNTYLILGQYRRRIPLTQNLYAWVYAARYEEMMQSIYYAHISPAKGSHYALRSYQGEDGKWKSWGMHKDVMPPPKGMIVDHKHSMDTLNNCDDNLRIASYSQNSMNKRAHTNNTSGQTNVRQRGKFWEVRVCVKGVSYCYYPYDTFAEACAARDEIVKQLHEEFASFDDKDIVPSFEWGELSQYIVL